MKKMFLILFLFIFLCTGCSNEGGSVKVNKLDTKVDYYVFRDRKIYLTNNFEEYVLQFKGLGCKLEVENSSISGEINIDEINSSNHEFYSLSSTAGSVWPEIRCYTEGEIFPAKFSLSFVYGMEESLLKNKVLEYWSIYPAGEKVQLSFDGSKFSFGGYKKDNELFKNDVRKILSSYNYEEDAYSDNSINVSVDGFNYEFIFKDSDDSLTIFSVQKY